MAADEMTTVDETEDSVNDGSLDLSTNPRYKELAELNDVELGNAPEKPAEQNEEKQVEANETSTESTKPEDEAKKKLEIERNPKSISNREAKRLAYNNKLLQQRLEQMEAKMQSLTEKKDEKKATRSDFRNDDDYIEYVASQKMIELERQKMEAGIVETKQRQQYEQLASSWENKISKIYPTESERAVYLEKLENLGHPSEVLDERINNYIFKNPIGPKMIEYLSDRPNIIPVLREMHDWDLANTLQKIVTYLGSTGKSQPTQKPRASSAPAPIGKLGAGATGAIKAEDDMTDAELMAAYRSGRLKF